MHKPKGFAKVQQAMGKVELRKRQMEELRERETWLRKELKRVERQVRAVPMQRGHLKKQLYIAQQELADVMRGVSRDLLRSRVRAPTVKPHQRGIRVRE